jgi:folate-binding protein YgfZ
MAPEILNQYRALTAGFGLVDVNDRTHIEITGADRTRFLHGFCTNEIHGLQRGLGCEAFLTNVKGKTMGHVLVFCGEQSLMLDSTAGQTETITDHLNRYIIREDVAVGDLSQEMAELLIAGRDAPAALADLTDAPLPIGALAHTSCRLADMEIHVRRVPFGFEPSFLVACSRSSYPQLTASLTRAGAAVCDAAVLDIVRTEAGFPFYGRDITADNLPQEVHRDEQAISFDKGCYLGQETVARIDALGHVNRLLVGLRWSTPKVPQAGLELVVDQRRIGHVTSAVWSPRLGAPLSLAYIRRDCSQSGTRLETERGVAEVVDFPLPG